MKTLEELREKIAPIPSLFAKDASDISSVDGREGKMDFVGGFSSDFASKDTTGEYLHRADFNRFGEIASREIHYRESGGRHTFSDAVKTANDGYPKNSVLDAFDGDMLTRVESTVERNPVNFCDSAGIAQADKIDCPVTITRSGEPTINAVAWRTVTRGYGADEGLFSLNLDYTRAVQLTNGSVIKEDSYVIGARDILLVGKLDKMSFYTAASTPCGNFGSEIESKGKSGDAFGYWPLIWIESDGSITIKKLPTIGQIAGSTNYFMAFFAKKGSTFTGRVNNIANGGDVKWTAIPISPRVISAEEAIND